MRYLHRACCLSLWILFGALACQRAPSDAAPTDTLRIVSLAPNVTELLFHIGAGQSVVGRTTHCDYPEASAAISVIGSGLEPDIEAIIQAQPTLIAISEMQRDLGFVTYLQRLGYDLVIVPDETVDDVVAALRVLGEVTGQHESAARTAAELEAGFASIREHGMRRPYAPRTLVVVGVQPIYAAGAQSRVDTLITWAGGVNALTYGDWIQLDDESMRALNPELVITSLGDVAQERLAFYADMDAVRGGHICAIDPDALSRPGPRLVQALGEINGCIDDFLVERSATTPERR